jgi:hypothetical protein
MKKMNTYWISFATDKDGHLGCCIVDAENEKEALAKTFELNINAGGEALLVELDTNNETAIKEINQWGKNKLITPQELVEDGYCKLNQLDEGLVDSIECDPSVSRVCEKHNKPT